jgi:hypothetical protein
LIKIPKALILKVIIYTLEISGNQKDLFLNLSPFRGEALKPHLSCREGGRGVRFCVSLTT